MNKKTRTILAGILGISLLTGIFAIDLDESRLGVQAQGASFNGIHNIISESGDESEPFTLVELVPDMSMAKLGYMVSGSEPEDWKKELAEKQTAEDRKAYMTALAAKRSLISAETPTKPLLYLGEYKERYALPESGETGWEEIKLKTEVTLAKGTTGYTAKEVKGGSYSASVRYVPSEAGDYVENIKEYTTASSITAPVYNYIVSFTEASEAAVNASEVLYRASDADKIQVNGFDEIAGLKESRYLYRKAKADAASPYEAVGKKENVTAADIDTVNYDYFLLTFEAVAKNTLTADELNNNTYYVVGSSEFSIAAKGEYYPVLADKSYEKVDDGKGNFKRTSEELCVYVGSGNGDTELYFEESASLAIDAVVPHIYCRGGYSNNDWFKRGVFLKTLAGATGTEDMHLKVVTLTPAELDIYLNEGKSIDFLYISVSNSLVNENFTYSVANNLSATAYESLLKRARPSETDKGILPMPVAVEVTNTASYGAVSAGTIGSLVKELTKNEADIDKDKDRHYVDKNVYVLKADSAGKEPELFEAFATDFIRKDTDDNAFIAEADKKGFGEIARSIRDENGILSAGISGTTQNTEMFTREISKARAVEYVISYAYKRKLNSDSVIRILNIEPAPVLKGGLTKEKVLKLFTDAKLTVKDAEIVTMPTSEFIGSIEDLANYDLIWFGLNTSSFNTSDVNSDGKSTRTVYNDDYMNGLIYSNIGDVMVGNADPGGGGYIGNSRAGLLDSDYIGGSERIKLNREAFLPGRNLRTGSSEIRTYSGVPAGYAAYDALSFWNNLDRYRKARTTSVLSADTTNHANTYRLPGNDITREKLLKLTEYIKAGYPVILADNFVTADGKINGTHIDNSSNIYELFNKLYPRENIMTESGISGEGIAKLYNRINIPKPDLEIKQFTETELQDAELVKKELYLDPTESPSSITKDSIQVRKLKNATLEIDFAIDNKGISDKNLSFDVELYVDINSDGKFSKINGELVYNYDYVILDGVTEMEPEGGVFKLPVSNGNYYRLSYKMGKEAIGIIPWKLKIIQNDSSTRYDAKTGYGYVETPDGSRKPINVLQLMTNGTNGSFNMAEEMKKKGSGQFGGLVDNVKDFKINITSKQAKNCTAEELKNYDMLILGFADVYSIQDGILDGLKEFIRSGKPVLFSHDNTSFVNSPETVNWGYSFNTRIRDLVGLDRYGISDKETELGRHLQADGKLVSGTAAEKAEFARKAVELANSDPFGIKDVAYEPKSGRSRVVKHAQGLTYGQVVFFGPKMSTMSNKYATEFVEKYNSGKAKVERTITTINAKSSASISNASTKNQLTLNGQYAIYNSILTNSSEISNNNSGRLPISASAEMINRGQITTYPYKIPSKLSIGRTHYQPYQVDLNEDSDGDGESDAIVWYTLAAGGFSSPSANDRNFYATSPRDVRNNYYIYTKGNITYSGVGHNSEVTSKPDELKLYINTIVAAYKSVRKAPEITFKEGFGRRAKEQGISYVSYDISDGSEPAELDGTENIKVYFSVHDNNLVRNLLKKTAYVSVAATGDEILENLVIYNEEDNQAGTTENKADKTYTKIILENKKKGETAVSGSVKTFYVNVPKALLKNKGMVEVKVSAWSVIEQKKAGKNTTEADLIVSQTAVADAKHLIQKRGLFDLD